MNPEHNRANPQRATDEYKKNTIKCRYCNDTGWEDDVVVTAYGVRQGFECVHCKKDTPPLLKLGQGREDESSDLDLTPLVLLVSVLSGAALVGIMALAVYAWKFING